MLQLLFHRQLLILPSQWSVHCRCYLQTAMHQPAPNITYHELHNRYCTVTDVILDVFLDVIYIILFFFLFISCFTIGTWFVCSSLGLVTIDVLMWLLRMSKVWVFHFMSMDLFVLTFVKLIMEKYTVKLSGREDSYMKIAGCSVQGFWSTLGCAAWQAS